MILYRKRADLMKCIENLFSSIEVCMTEEQQQDLNVTRRAIDAGIDFICHKEGDHIACEELDLFFWSEHTHTPM